MSGIDSSGMASLFNTLSAFSAGVTRSVTPSPRENVLRAENRQLSSENDRLEAENRLLESRRQALERRNDELEREVSELETQASRASRPAAAEGDRSDSALLAAPPDGREAVERRFASPEAGSESGQLIDTFV